jgi:hypothetical protein
MIPILEEHTQQFLGYAPGDLETFKGYVWVRLPTGRLRVGKDCLYAANPTEAAKIPNFKVAL